MLNQVEKPCLGQSMMLRVSPCGPSLLLQMSLGQERENILEHCQEGNLVCDYWRMELTRTTDLKPTRFWKVFLPLPACQGWTARVRDCSSQNQHPRGVDLSWSVCGLWANPRARETQNKGVTPKSHLRYSGESSQSRGWALVEAAGCVPGRVTCPSLPCR